MKDFSVKKGERIHHHQTCCRDMLKEVLQAEEKIMPDKNSNPYKGMRKTGNENVRVTVKNFFSNLLFI